jgi:hypothetical protein
MNDEVSQSSVVDQSELLSHRCILFVLISGIVLRIAVFLTASPFNPDPHLEVIDFIAKTHQLPASLEMGQAHQPPLYHMLMAPIWAATGSAKVLQAVSLLFSIANLLITAKLLLMLVESKLARSIALAFVALLPQLVMYGSFVSNDSLTILLGTILFLRGALYSKNPTTRNAIWLGMVCGLGLLTKGTFLLAPAAIVILVLVRGSRPENEDSSNLHGLPLAPPAARVSSPEHEGERVRRLPHLAIILSICVLLGGYKYAENLANYGRPFVHNLDPNTDWKREQQGAWRNVSARWNLNLIHILREPILKLKHPASYPVLMYATLWYPHWPDSSYTANVNGYAWVGQTLYLAGIVPTGLLIAGLFRRGGIDRSHPEFIAVHRFAASLLLLNIALVMAVGVKFDVWSCFQARLCFASFAPGLILFAWAFESSRWKKILLPFLLLAITACLLYFVVEIAFANGWLPKGVPVTP